MFLSHIMLCCVLSHCRVVLHCVVVLCCVVVVCYVELCCVMFCVALCCVVALCCTLKTLFLSHLQGFINLGTSENKLCFDLLHSRVSETTNQWQLVNLMLSGAESL